MFDFFGCSLANREIEKETKNKKSNLVYRIPTLKIKSLIHHCAEYEEALTIIKRLKKEVPYGTNYSYNEIYNKPRRAESFKLFYRSETTIGKHIRIQYLTQACQLALTKEQLKLYEKLKTIQKQHDEENSTLTVESKTIK